MIKKYLQFINEISGTELVGPVGLLMVRQDYRIKR